MNTQIDARKIIDALGGTKEVRKITGLTRGRISQWATRGEITLPWLMYFQSKYKRLDWKSLLQPVGATNQE